MSSSSNEILRAEILRIELLNNRNIDFLVSIFSSINKRLKPPNLPEFGLCFQGIV